MRQVFALCGITLSIKRWAEYNKKCYDSQNIPRETHVVSVLAPYNILYGFGAVLFYIGAVKLQHKSIAVQVAIMTAFATTLELLCGLILWYGLGMRAWVFLPFGELPHLPLQNYPHVSKPF